MRNKTDRTDVDGLLEAFRNEQIRPVPIKTVTQQVIATLHRLRSVLARAGAEWPTGRHQTATNTRAGAPSAPIR
jgi:hypothetical protein